MTVFGKSRALPVPDSINARSKVSIESIGPLVAQITPVPERSALLSARALSTCEAATAARRERLSILR